MPEPNVRAVLIIDDHPGFRKLLRLHLCSKWGGARIDESDPVAEGRQPGDYAAGDYDLVLLDYQLGGQSGFEFLRHFRTVAGFPPVIMLTGEGNERLAVEAIKLGAVDYIPKQDMTHDVLIRAVQEALGNRDAADRRASTAAPLSIPERSVRIRGLRLTRKLAEGGMSTVHLCESDDGEQRVLKISDLRGAESDVAVAMQRFEREYEVLRRIQHPSIVRIHDQGFTDDYAYITMEYLAGGSLRERMRQPVSTGEAVRLVLRIAAALDVVHRNGIVHRDIKPHNIMFRGDGSLALIDFGVARALNESSDLTRVGQILGTPHYISPEQIDGRVPDARSDLYSLGAIFFELLTDSVPYAARTPLAVMYKHKHAPIPVLPENLQRFQPVIERLLAKDAAGRYSGVSEFTAAVTQAANQA
jgi:eukaryotic-like serine/threonine-protein kinase